MKVIFEKTIFEQIDDAKRVAEATGKVIREIRLSKVETAFFLNCGHIFRECK